MVNKCVGLFVCVIIIVLDIIAGILGVRAEAAQNQEKHLRLWLFECNEPSREAFRLGCGAILLLIVAHVLANLLNGCTLCSQNEIHKASLGRQLSLLSLFFTWVIAAVGLGLLVISKSQIECFVWTLASPFPFYRRDFVFRSFTLFYRLLRYCHCFSPLTEKSKR